MRTHNHAIKARELLKRHGYSDVSAVKEMVKRADGGALADKREDRQVAASAVHKHEKHDHKGEPLTKLARGGSAKGKAGGGKAGHTHVNVIVAPQGGGGAPMPPRPPTPIGPPAAGAAPPPRPPMAPGMGVPGGGMPPGGMPGGGMPPGLARPPGALKRGGKVKAKRRA